MTEQVHHRLGKGMSVNVFRKLGERGGGKDWFLCMRSLEVLHIVEDVSH